MNQLWQGLFRVVAFSIALSLRLTGLGLYEGKDPGVGVGRQSRLHLADGDRGSPVVVDHHRDSASAHDVLHHAPAEGAVTADDHLVAGFDQVDEARLHADGAWPRHREGDLVRRLEGVAKELLELLHHPHELGVEVTDRGTSHRL